MAKTTALKENNVTSILPSYTEEETSELINMKRKVELINSGFIVHIANVEKSKDNNNYVILTVTLLSEVNRMPVFGDVELKVTRQALPRLKSELAKVG